MRLFSDASIQVSDPWLRHAYELAECGRGATAPNPIVGCVLVRGGMVGEGFHAVAGGPHAEIAALADAGAAAEGATAYITLEPCNHTGRTGPCVPALVAAGVTRVVIGMRDPNPAVEGCGSEALRQAGVEVTFAEDPTPFELQNEAWIARVTTGLPFVRVKVALSLDGRPAIANGRRAAITGRGGASVTQQLRWAAEAVAVGSSTLAVDDPALTVRDPDGKPASRQPLRIVLAQTSAPLPSARLLTDGLGPAVVVLSDRAPVDAVERLHAAGVGVGVYPHAEGLRGALRTVAEAGISDLLVEAGPGLFSALWDAGLVDELVVLHAGGLAGAPAPPLYAGPPPSGTSALPTPFECVEAGVAERDAVTVWRPGQESAGPEGP